GLTNSPLYREAVAKQQESARLARTSGPVESLKSSWEAADLFTKATEQGRVAAVPPTPPPAAPTQTPQTPAPVTRPPDPPPPIAHPRPPVQTPPQQAPPPPAPAPSQPAPARPVPVNEEPGIRATLRAFEQAYSARSADAVKRLFPSVNAKGIEQGFSQMK